MKVRPLKLKEAHKNPNGANSLCSISWDLEAQHLVTCSASDSSISIHDLLQPSNPPKILRHHKDGVTAIALSPNSTCLASGSVDHSVKLYRFPAGEFQTNITRFTLPIRALAFNKSGSMLAGAGDDEGIKLINTIDGSIFRVLKGHKGSVSGLVFDPKSEYLASLDSIGTIIIWELSSGNVIHNLKGLAPDFGSDKSILNVLSWSPDGEVIAVPGLKNDVVMYDRDTAEKLFSLKGEHEKSVCFLSWSPNGKYIATSGLDSQVLIWDIDQREVIIHQKFDDRISCMSWKPNGNALAVIDVMGKYGVWDPAVPSTMKSPSDGAPSHKSNGLLLFDEDDDQPSASGSLNDVGEDSLNKPEPVSRKRLHKHHAFDDVLDEDSNDEVDLLPNVEPRKKASRLHKDRLHDGNEEVQSVTKSATPKLQEAFQPGSTPVQAGKRRFLCYNMLGSITTIETSGCFNIEVDFHDTGRGPRVPSMAEYVGFTMAALNENGSVFANACKGEKNMSTLMYRPFSSWANNSEWSMRFEGEEVKVVALGTGWIAAVTSVNYLRIFTEGGLQKHVLALDAPVVTASGFKDELAVVTHASHPLPSDDQMLEFRVFNISNGTQPLKGRLPLTPGSCLTWFGYSEEGQLSSYDSKGVLKVFTNQFGGRWLPLFSASKEKNSDESYWMVGLNESKFFCIVCKSPESYPQVTPKPFLTLLDLSFPLASSDLGADNLENEFILTNLYIYQTQKKIEDMLAAGLDTTTQDDEAFTLETSLDRCILRLIAACCNADKLVRATELVRLLTLEKSIKGAIKLVTALKLPVLAERFSGVLEERLLNETMETIGTPNIAFNAAQTKCVTERKPVIAAKDKASEHANALPPTKMTSALFQKQEKAEGRPSPLFQKQEKVQGRASPLFQKQEIVEGREKTEPNVTTSERNVKAHSSNLFPKALNDHESLPLSNSKRSIVDENIKSATSQAQFHRPSNPFAKASYNQEKSSLFDSLKKNGNNGSVH